MSDTEIRKTIEVDAPPEVVFRALSIQEEITQWFPDQAVLEPRVGGKVRFSFFSKGKKPVDRDFFPEGEVTEFVPNKKISYTWIPSGIPGFPKTTVTWSLEAAGEGRTRVTMVHSGFTGMPHELFREHSYGWDYFTGRLARYCNSC